MPAPEVIRIYTSNLIVPANTFSAGVGDATSNAGLQDTATTLAALLRVENDRSVQRAILHAAPSAQPPVLGTENLYSLQQANAQQEADLTAFNTSADSAESLMPARSRPSPPDRQPPLAVSEPGRRVPGANEPPADANSGPDVFGKPLARTAVRGAVRLCQCHRITENSGWQRRCVVIGRSREAVVLS
jgi:hypothetical protein